MGGLWVPGSGVVEFRGSVWWIYFVLLYCGAVAMLRGVGTPSAASCALQGLVPVPVSGFAVRHCGAGELRNARVGSNPKVLKGVFRRTDRAVVVKTLAIQKNLVDQVRGRAGREPTCGGQLCMIVKELDLINLFILKLQGLVIEVLCCTELFGCKSIRFLVFWHKPAL